MLNTQTPNMPELRKDPIVHRWVVMSPDRASRPSDLHMESQLQFADSDPFAEGNESATTSEILAYRDHASIGDGPGWRVRVIPNKFPALKMTGNLNRHRDGIYEAMNGLGSHEVIVECPQCETNMSRLSADNIHEVLCAYRARLIDLKQDQRLVHATIFKNNGVLAGASLAHSHSQLIATPIVPVTIQEEIAGSLEFNHRFQRSIFEAMIQQELESGSRIVLDSPGFLAFCPYASRFPYEVCILPKHSSSHFENSSTQDLRDLGNVLQQVLRKLEFAIDDPAYNYVLHTAPFNQPELPHFCWHFEIFPRTTQVGGFEWGSGYYINSVFPEEAAKRLREIGF